MPVDGPPPPPPEPADASSVAPSPARTPPTPAPPVPGDPAARDLPDDILAARTAAHEAQLAHGAGEALRGDEDLVQAVLGEQLSEAEVRHFAAALQHVEQVPGV